MIRNAILAFGLAFSTLAQDAPGPAPVLECGKPSDGLSLSLSSDKPEYRPGETVLVTAILKNISDAPIWVGSTSIWRLYQMEILAPAAEWLPFRPPATRTPLGERNLGLEVNGVGGMRLPPGLQVRHEFELNTLYRMTDPGHYYITFAYKNPGADRGNLKICVTSNQVKVTILAARE